SKRNSTKLPLGKFTEGKLQSGTQFEIESPLPNRLHPIGTFPSEPSKLMTHRSNGHRPSALNWLFNLTFNATFKTFCLVDFCLVDFCLVEGTAEAWPGAPKPLN
ncbi:MAG: hypothetical protein ACUVSQ_10475, partial [Pseudanabaenaceae cyanobacterium]